jgi:hypothetical protein
MQRRFQVTVVIDAHNDNAIQQLTAENLGNFIMSADRLHTEATGNDPAWTIKNATAKEVPFAYVAIARNNNTISRADKDIYGHTPCPELGTFDDYITATQKADELNFANGLTPTDAIRIVASTLRNPMDQALKQTIQDLVTHTTGIGPLDDFDGDKFFKVLEDNAIEYEWQKRLCHLIAKLDDYKNKH